MDFIKAHWKQAPLAIVSLLAALLLWFDLHQQRVPVGVAVQAKPAPEVAKATKTDTPVKSGTVKTYAPAVKRKLALPPQVQADDKQQVIEASQVAADDHPQTITTLIDTQTGETVTYVNRDALPLLALDSAGELGMYYGLKNGASALRLEGRQGLFAIKALHVGVIGSLDQPLGGMQSTATFIGAGAWMRW